jgi:hypothetical protein
VTHSFGSFRPWDQVTLLFRVSGGTLWWEHVVEKSHLPHGWEAKERGGGREPRSLLRVCPNDLETSC